MTRALSEKEYLLAKWLLENGNEYALSYIDQLEHAVATNQKCDCASFDVKFKEIPKAESGVHILSHHRFNDNNSLASVFKFSSNGVLLGNEVYGCETNAPRYLPAASELILD